MNKKISIILTILFLFALTGNKTYANSTQQKLSDLNDQEINQLFHEYDLDSNDIESINMVEKSQNKKVITFKKELAEYSTNKEIYQSILICAAATTIIITSFTFIDKKIQGRYEK